MGIAMRLLRKTPLYRLHRRLRAAHYARQWTDHDRTMAAFYADYVRAGDLVFDVGANLGNRTKVFLRLGARVVAVEPQGECARFLALAFGATGRLTVIEKALGAAEGHADLLVSEASTISSFSHEWVQAVRSSGRFSDYSWSDGTSVELTTLDSLMDIYGIPAFIKIDVEGYELEVLKGMTRRPAALSFEFTPEFMDCAIHTLHHLQSLGPLAVNYSLGESMKLELLEYVPVAVLLDILGALRGRVDLFGDVYCRFR
jgi:FkbM family methyltransferase